MAIAGKLQLKIESIRSVPLYTYDKFTFIVNHERFETSRIIADLLSSEISRIHHTDPTVNEYIINTHHKGRFTNFLRLIRFEKTEISENEIPFIREIIAKLGYDSFKIAFSDEPTKITNENVLSILDDYVKYGLINQKKDKLINYIAAHFGEIIDEKWDQIEKIDIDLLDEILSNQKLKIQDEDQLLHLINSLYAKDKRYSNLYGHVLFQNAEPKMIDEFIELYDINDINYHVWISLSKRLTKKISNNKKHQKNRYKKQIIVKEEENQIPKNNIEDQIPKNNIEDQIQNRYFDLFENDFSFPSSGIVIEGYMDEI